MGKILPILLVLIGIGAGVGTGLALRPVPDPVEAVDADDVEAVEPPEVELDEAELAFVKINNQFVVPVINDDRVSALVVMSLSLETKASMTEAVYNREPKLRDAFLQVLFDHAYLGGFDGVYTASPAMETLRAALLASARRIAGPTITDILITDIVRQDL